MQPDRRRDRHADERWLRAGGIPVPPNVVSVFVEVLVVLVEERARKCDRLQKAWSVFR
jgi:hypothetical protein